MNVLAVSLLVGAFSWHTPPLTAQTAGSHQLPYHTLAVMDPITRQVTLRDDWRGWPTLLTCTVISDATQLTRGPDTVPAQLPNISYPVSPQCRYVFGGRQTTVHVTQVYQ